MAKRIDIRLTYPAWDFREGQLETEQLRAIMQKFNVYDGNAFVTHVSSVAPGRFEKFRLEIVQVCQSWDYRFFQCDVECAPVRSSRLVAFQVGGQLADPRHEDIITNIDQGPSLATKLRRHTQFEMPIPY